MKNILNRIISDNIKYNNVLGIIILVLGMLALGLYKFSFIKNDYHFAKGSVEIIRKDFYIEKSTPTFGPVKYVKKEGIEIILNNTSYIIIQSVKNKWDFVLENVKNGDEISIMYRYFDDSSQKSIHELKVHDKKILSIEERYKSLKYIIAFMVIIFTVGVYLLIYLIIKKKKYNAN